MEKEQMHRDIIKDAAAIKDRLLEVRHYLHRFPEPAMKEFITSSRIREELDDIGLSWQEVEKTGTLARLDGAYPGPAIILRADIDALPLEEKSRYPYPSENKGFMHACGHDVHAAALLGAARLLHSYRSELHGSVIFVFQQAEEQGHGSQYFINAGVTEGVDAVYGFHVTPEAPLGGAILTDGTDMASCDHMIIRLFGKKSHIARPHLGNDATAAAADLIMRLRDVLTSFDPLDNVLIGVGRVSSGNTWNIVSDYAEIEGTVRALSKRSHDLAVERTKELIDRIAALHNVRAEYEFETNTTCLVNHPEAIKVMKEAAERVISDSGEIIMRYQPLWFGGDDFAAFSERIPGCFIHLGTSVMGQPDTAVPLHSDEIFISDDVIPIGTAILTECALAHLL